MDYLIRFVQAHETFRQPEINALAELTGIEVKWIFYDADSPFAIVRFLNTLSPGIAAKALIARSILTMTIHELWAVGPDYTTIHETNKCTSQHLWHGIGLESFRFETDCFRGSRSKEARRAIYETFAYMGFAGPIVMTNAQHQFTVFENYILHSNTPKKIFFGRFVAESGRRAITTFNLKKRKYISTTSMDAELSLVTANLALAGPGKIAYDPFTGTGSFPLCCAHYGSVVLGSDMDGRSIRGKGNLNVRSNFVQYGLEARYLGGFVADLTNTPVRRERIVDVIVCDPPYGVREGLKVLGSTKAGVGEEVILSNGIPAHVQEGYVPPKKPYSFVRMLDDILDFSAETLVDGGRLCMWMPVAGNVEDVVPSTDPSQENRDSEIADTQTEFVVPSHPALNLLSLCTQDFNRWSRRLLTYCRRPQNAVDKEEEAAHRLKRSLNQLDVSSRASANELNDFRKQYFQGFKPPSKP